MLDKEEAREIWGKFNKILDSHNLSALDGLSVLVEYFTIAYCSIFPLNEEAEFKKALEIYLNAVNETMLARRNEFLNAGKK